MENEVFFLLPQKRKASQWDAFRFSDFIISKIDWQGVKIVFYRHFSTKIAVCSKRKTPDQMIRRFHGAANQI